MLFNSLNFLIFFPLVTAAYFLLPHRFRWFLLLAASCYFYMAFIPAFILILAFTITVDYFAGIAIEQAERKKRKQFLVASIIANVGVLFFFKYFNFFNANLAALADFLHWNYSLHALSIILPIGLSFHTFQSLSYTIEVYRNKQKAERHFGIFALYVMFYPQLVAGPIERPQNLLHQFREKHYFDVARVTSGLERMLWGLFKKVVIADRAARVVDIVYSQPDAHTGLAFILATVFFAFQIYADFSGYSDIAIGAARVMGFSLMNNFDRPYTARSISEFWRRWHISLSTWFKDYVYIPLGGNRGTHLQQVRNLLITFTLSGLWHGANWTYVIWGALNGSYLVAEMMIKNITTRFGPIKHRLLSWLVSLGQVLLTFTLICIAWIFFRAASLSDALFILRSSFTDGVHDVLHLDAARIALHGLGVLDITLVSAGIVFMLSLEHFSMRSDGYFGVTLKQLEQERVVRYARAYVLLLWILVFGLFVKNNFIYFQF